MNFLTLWRVAYDLTCDYFPGEMGVRWLIGLILFASAASLCQALDDTAAAASPSGQACYQRLCKSCHGDNGRGNAAKATALKLEPQLLDLARPEAAKLTREQRRKVLLEGKGKMPAYGKKLKPEEVEPLLDHVDELVKSAAKAQ